MRSPTPPLRTAARKERGVVPRLRRRRPPRCPARTTVQTKSSSSAFAREIATHSKRCIYGFIQRSSDSPFAARHPLITRTTSSKTSLSTCGCAERRWWCKRASSPTSWAPSGTHYATECVTPRSPDVCMISGTHSAPAPRSADPFRGQTKMPNMQRFSSDSQMQSRRSHHDSDSRCCCIGKMD